VEKKELGKGNVDVLIRDFRKSDIDQVLDLLPMCFAREFEVTGFDSDHARDMANRAFGKTGRLFLGLARLFGKEPLKFFVAEVHGKVVGTTIVNSNGSMGYISTVMVHPDNRRKGIATELLKTAIAYLNRKGMHRGVLHVDTTNTPAMSVYVKLGFREFERITYLIGETGSLPTLQDTSEVKTRVFQKDDVNDVYNLIISSEDPNRLRIHDFTKADLKTPFLQRLFRFSTQIKIVAKLDGKIVGYAETSYTTPKEAGSIRSIQTAAQNRSREIEKALMSTAIEEIRKGGINRIRVMVATTQQALIESLKNMGFKESLLMDGMFIEV